MTNYKAFLERHPLRVYYILTFVLSWAGMLLVIGPSGIPGTPEVVKKLLPLAIPPMLLGPSVSGLLLTGLTGGKTGLRSLLSRLLRWRVGLGWWTVALLAGPLLMTVVPLALSPFFPDFKPQVLTTDDKASLFQLAIGAGLGAGFFEELGWTGFALPRLRTRYSLLATGLFMGALWGAWHLLVNIWSSGNPAGGLSPALFLHSFIFSAGILPAYRILMVWVHDHTGSLLVAMFMHAGLTTGNVLFAPSMATGPDPMAWSLALTGALWAVVAVVLWKTKAFQRRFS